MSLAGGGPHPRLRRDACRGWWLAALLVAATGSLSAQSLPDSSGRVIAAGNKAWDSGERDSAYVHYRSAFASDPRVSTQVLFRLATLESERNRLEPAIALLREYVRLEPSDHEGRLALARVLAWRGRYDQSIGAYDQVLASDSTYRDAVLGRAQALAWAARFPAAVAAYERWLAQMPGDTAAELALARTLSWAGQLQDAESRYAAVAGRVGSADAERGVAQVSGWRGDLTRSERLWRGLTERYPNDVASWIGLAQVQRWAGRSQAADTSLRRALAVAPLSADAREAMQLVRVELAGAAEPAATHASDSDGNRMRDYAVTMLLRPAKAARLRFTGAVREAAYLGATGRSIGARGGLVWSSPGRRLSSTTELGAARLTSQGRGRGSTAHTRPWVVQRLALTPMPRVSAGLTFTAVPFDETATLIAGGIHTRGLDADLSVTLPGRVSLGLGGGRTTINGGVVPNERRAVGAAARWGARAGLSLAVTARGMAYDTTGRADGYFAPSRFTLVETSVRKTLGGGGERGWGATLEGGLGRQAIRFAAGDPTRDNMASRGSAALRFTPFPGYEVEASAGASTVASPFAQGASEYSATWMALRARIKVF